MGEKNIFGKSFGHATPEMHKHVFIGHDVWIGEKVFINDGLIIGNGAVIGAHSVVTHNIPPYAIAVGAPAKVIKYRFTPKEIDRIEQSKWREWSEARLAKEGDKFISIEEFKKII